jgi:3-deoxy-D-manno-octulosonic-acid transferase
LASRLYNLVDFYCVQTEAYRQRLAKLGVAGKKMAVTGNIKYDALFPKMPSSEEEAFRKKLHIQPGDQVITIGSTHEQEEEQVLKALGPFLKKSPHLKLLLVPRHPERFDSVSRLLRKMEIPHMRYSKPGKEEQVVLIDAMGVLCSCYQISSVAVVAGSFTDRIGGHNLLEPAAYGVPALFGPHTFTQKEMRDLILEANAGEESEVTDLAAAVERNLASPEKGSNGRALLSSLQGSIDKTVAAVTGS